MTICVTEYSMYQLFSGKKMYLTTYFIVLMIAAEITTYNPTPATETVPSYQTASTLQDFCRFLSILPSNCSCEASPLVCQLKSFGERAKRNDTESIKFQRNNGMSLTYASIAIISSIFGTIGNAAVICIAYRQRRKLSPCKLHIAELAVVNLIFSLVQIINVVPLYWTNTWIYGKVGCKLMKGVLEIGSLLSSGFFQLISIERYFYIVPTFDITKVKKFCRTYKHVLLLCNLVFVAVTVTPLFIGLDIEHNSQRCVNFIDGNRWMLSPYTWLTFIVYSMVPICVITVLSINLKNHFAAESTASLMVHRGDINRNVISHMLLVLSLFILCTLPARLLTIIIDMLDFQSGGVLLGLQLTAYTLYSLQGTLNPILYSMLAREWRKNLYAMVRSVFLKRKDGSVTTSSSLLHEQYLMKTYV